MADKPEFDDVSMASIPAGDLPVVEATAKETEATGDEEVKEGESENIPTVIEETTTETETEKKGENPLNAVGSWFSGLVGGVDGMRQRSGPSEGETPSDKQDEEAATVIEDDAAKDEENAKKRGGIKQQAAALYSACSQKTVAMFASCTDVTKKHCSSCTDNTKKHFSNRRVQIAAAAIFVLILILAIAIPLAMNGSSDVGLFLKEFGRVERSLQADMIKHPSYQGDLFPYGKVTLKFDEDNWILAMFRLDGLEDHCDGCKWFIKEGSSCDSQETIGIGAHVDWAHHPTSPFDDPTASYNADMGVSQSISRVFTGYGYEDNIDHTVVLMASDGSGLACGVLKRHGTPATNNKKLWANMASLSQNYAGEIDGHVRMEFSGDDSFYLGFDMEGLPADCRACRIAVHQGTSCKADPGIPFWNDHVLKRLPWIKKNGASFNTDSTGATAVRHGFYLYDGYSHDEHEGQIIIVYGPAGDMIGCGELTKHPSRHVWTEATTAALSGGIGETITADALPSVGTIVVAAEHHSPYGTLKK